MDVAAGRCANAHLESRRGGGETVARKRLAGPPARPPVTVAPTVPPRSGGEGAAPRKPRAHPPTAPQAGGGEMPGEPVPADACLPSDGARREPLPGHLVD